MELLGLDRAELRSICEQLGHSSFRGDQIADWLYGKGAREFDAMANLPRKLREALSDSASISRSEIVERSAASDRTTKYLLKMADGETVESVLLPYEDRVSVCVSSQVGCAMGCTFCATADCGFVRNLNPGEIVDQALTMRDDGRARVSHVVFMGMGEPLHNLPGVLQAIRVLNTEMGIGMRRITISTVGVTPGIRRLAELNLQLTLAVSLHAPDDATRERLIPMAHKYPIEGLLDACRAYAQQTRRRITFEYLMLSGINDSPDQAQKLAALLRGIIAGVNLIPYNHVAGKTFRKSSRAAIADFRRVLEDAGIEVTQRMERGHSVAAACGQLKHSRQTR